MSEEGLDKAVVSVPFTGGAETKINPALVDKGKLLSLTNYAFTKDGTLARRQPFANGFSQSAISTTAELAAWNAELVSINSTNSVTTYSSVNGAASGRGTAPFVSARQNRIMRNNFGQVYLDSATTTTGVTCYVWSEDLRGIYCTIVDEATGAILVNDLKLATLDSGRPRICILNGYFCVFYIDATNTISQVSVSATAPITSAIAYGPTVVSSATIGITSHFDVVSVGASCLVVYETNTATKNIACVTTDQTTAVITTELQLISSASLAVAATCIGVAAFSTTKCTVFVGATGLAQNRCVVVNVAAGVPTIAAGPTTVTVANVAFAITAVAISSTTLQVFSCAADGTTAIVANSTYSWGSTGVAGSVTSFCKSITAGGTGPKFGPFPAGKAFLWSGTAYLPMCTGTTIQQKLFVVDSSGNVVVRAFEQTLGPYPTNGYLPTTTSMVATNEFSIPVYELGPLSISSGVATTQQGISRARIAFGRTYNSGTPYLFTPLWHANGGACLYFSGANPSFYDGASTTEAGFHWYPSAITAGDGGAAGLPNGSYLVCAVYEWVDGQGQRHQSTPSPSVTFAPALRQITMTAPTLQLGVRVAATTIVFYRTVASGTTFYRDSPVGTPLANSTTVGTVSYTSNVSDATLLTNEVLYNPTDVNSGGGTLFNDPPPACRAICSFQNRLVIAGLEDPYEWRYSQKWTQGVGLQWNQLLSGRIPQGFGEITALGVIDDKLVIYTPSHKFVVVGDGLAANGTGNGYADAQLMPSGVGCIDQRAIVNIPDISSKDVGHGSGGGQVYQSQQGLYLLTRGLSDEYIGEPVESSVIGAVISSGVVIENKSQVRFTSATGSKYLVYDFLYGQWSFYSGSSMVPESACMWQGQYTAADSGNNFIILESASTTDFRDFSTTAITGTIQTSWIKASALDGFQRVWRMLLEGTYQGPSSITIACAFDYDGSSASPNYTNTAFATSTLGITAAGLPLAIRHHLAQQKCAAVRFTITDVPSTSVVSGAIRARGTEFTGFTLEMGVKKGARKLPAVQSL